MFSFIHVYANLLGDEGRDPARGPIRGIIQMPVRKAFPQGFDFPKSRSA
jgi:hypothetical protein